MEKVKLFEDKGVTFEFVREGSYIQQTWRGYTTNNVFKNYMEILSDHLKAKRAKGILVDVREHKGLSMESQELAAKIALHYAQTCRGFKVATVTSENIFSKVSVENYNEKIKHDLIDNQYFDNIERAKSWLEN